MKSIDRAQLYSLAGLDLGDLTFSGTGAGKATMYANGTIVVETTTTAEASKTITIKTPAAFQILDVYSIHNNATSAKWTIKNNTAAITSLIVMAASDNDIDRAISIANAEHEFAEDDDDLVIDIDATGAALAIWVFQIRFLPTP